MNVRIATGRCSFFPPEAGGREDSWRAVLELSHSQPRAPKSHIAVQYTERLSKPKPTSAVISDTPYLIERGQGVVWQLEFRRRKILAQMSDG